MAFGILGFTGGCGGTVRSDNLCGKQDKDVSMPPRLGAIAADAVAVLAMGIILGVAAGGALHLSPAAAYGMTGAIAAIPLLDIGGTIFHSVVGRRHFNCLADKLTCLGEAEDGYPIIVESSGYTGRAAHYPAGGYGGGYTGQTVSFATDDSSDSSS